MFGNGFLPLPLQCPRCFGPSRVSAAGSKKDTGGDKNSAMASWRQAAFLHMTSVSWWVQAEGQLSCIFGQTAKKTGVLMKMLDLKN